MIETDTSSPPTSRAIPDGTPVVFRGAQCEVFYKENDPYPYIKHQIGERVADLKLVNIPGSPGQYGIRSKSEQGDFSYESVLVPGNPVYNKVNGLIGELRISANKVVVLHPDQILGVDYQPDFQALGAIPSAAWERIQALDGKDVFLRGRHLTLSNFDLSPGKYRFLFTSATIHLQRGTRRYPMPLSCLKDLEESGE